MVQPCFCYDVLYIYWIGYRSDDVQFLVEERGQFNLQGGSGLALFFVVLENREERPLLFIQISTASTQKVGFSICFGIGK